MKKYKIGFRTVKTAIAVSLAIIFSQLFHLDFFVSSAIITIICVQTSKKKSLKSASARFVACMLSLPFSYVFFEGISYHPLVIGLLLIFFIPATVFLKINEGVVTSLVIILHIYSAERMTWDIIMNEIGLIVIGIGAALLVNFYMPSLDKQLKAYQQQVETNMKTILAELADYLRTNEKKWTENELAQTMQVVRTAKNLAFRDVENHLLHAENDYYSYFVIREKQLEVLTRLLPRITSIQPMIEQRYSIADFIDELSLCIHPGNTEKLFLAKLNIVEEEFKTIPLPKTWETFEARTQLLQLVWEIKQYLLIKQTSKAAFINA